MKTWAWLIIGVWACISPIMKVPTGAFFTSPRVAREGEESGDVLVALNRIAQALDSHERHTALYERVSMLEENLNKKTANELKLESEVLELRAKIPALEAEIQTIPEMRKDLAEFEAKIEKLVHDYEAKLSTLASEVIRLKKYGARRKDLQILSDGSDNILLRTDAPVCREVGLGMAAERVGNQCLYFSWGTALNWTAAHRHCQSLGGDLSAPLDLLPLKTFLHRAFARGPSLWLGASYHLDDEDLNNLTDTKAIVNATGAANSTLTNPSDTGSEDSLSVRLSLRDSSGAFSNRIDDDNDDDDGVEDKNEVPDETNGKELTGRVALLSEVPAPEGGFLRDARITEHSSVLDNKLSSSTMKDLKSRFTDTPLASFVDFILLQDSESKNDQNGNSHASNSPSRDLTLNSMPTSQSEGELSIHIDPKFLLERSKARMSSELLREVREILEENTGEHVPGPGGQKEEDSKNAGKAKMKCMLLRQKESLEYELVGQPCDEQHRFVCEIQSSGPTDQKFTPDNLLHE